MARTTKRSSAVSQGCPLHRRFNRFWRVRTAGATPEPKDISLPLPMSDVSGLNAALSQINNSLSTLAVTISTLTSNVQGAQALSTVDGEVPLGSINGSTPHILCRHLQSRLHFSCSKMVNANQSAPTINWPGLNHVYQGSSKRRYSSRRLRKA